MRIVIPDRVLLPYTAIDMAPKLYFLEASTAVRGTLLTIKALGINVDLVPVNLAVGEHFKPEYLKLNPLHTVPTLEDGDFVIFDSHAINAYLVGKYGKDDSLYPKDLQKKAVIDQRLHFDSGILFPRGWKAIVAPLLKGEFKTIPKDKADDLTEAYSSLEVFLGNSTYVAGEQLSIADFSIAATMTSHNVLVPIDANTFPKVTAWLERIRKLPYYNEGNQKGLDQFANMITSLLS